MQYNEFVGQVQHRGRMSSRQEAEKAIRATLETLSERMAGGAAGNLAAQLPSELQSYVHSEGESERLSIDEFLSRVGERADLDPPDATYHARVVLDVLKDAVTPGTLDKLLAQFPEEFDQMFQGGTEGEFDLRME